MVPLSLSLCLFFPQPEACFDNYGDPLPAGAVARLGTLRYRRPPEAHLLGFTADAKAVVFGKQGELVFMDVATGKFTTRSLTKLLNAGAQGPRRWYGFQLSADGTTLLLKTSDWRLMVFDLAADKVVREFTVDDFVPLPQGDNDPDARFDLTRDGKTLIVLDNQPGSYRLRWVSTITGAVMRETPWSKRPQLRWLFHSPSGDFIGVPVLEGPHEAADVVLEVWEAVSARLVVRRVLPKDLHVDALGTDGKTIVCCRSGDRDWALVDLSSGKTLAAFGRSYPNVLSPDGKYTFGCAKEALEQWDNQTGKKLWSTPRATQRGGESLWLSLSPDRQRLLLKVGDLITIHDAVEGKALHKVHGHGQPVGALAWSPSGKELLTVAKDGRALAWATGPAKVVRELRPPDDRDTTPRKNTLLRLADDVAGVFADGQHLAASWSGYPLMVWDGTKKLDLPDLQAAYAGAEFCPVKSLFAFADEHGCVQLADPTLRQRRILTMTKPPDFAGVGTFRLLAFSADGRYLAGSGIVDEHRSPCYDHVIVWEVTTGKQVAHFRLVVAEGTGLGGRHGQLTVRGLCFSPKGKLAAAVEASIFVFDLATGREEQCFGGQNIAANSVAFNRDGTLLIAGTLDGAVRLWNVQTGKLIGDVPGHRGAVTSLAFAPDGKRLATGSADTTVLIWNVAELTRLASAAPAAASLETLWQQLGDAEPATARKAMAALAQHAGAVSLLESRLQPVPQVDSKAVATLIDELEDAKFARRAAATAKLEKLGGLARSALEARLKTDPSLELRQRLEALLARLEAPVTDADELRGLRGIELLEWIATPPARQLLERLAAGAPGHRLTEDAKAAWARSK
jgi:WD40 repeat protein